MNESIGYNCELLKGSGLIPSCFSRYSSVRIKFHKKTDLWIKTFTWIKLMGILLTLTLVM